MEEPAGSYEDRIRKFYDHRFRLHVAHLEGLSELVVIETTQSYMFRTSIASELINPNLAPEVRESILTKLIEAETERLERIVEYFRLLRVCLLELQADMKSHIETLTSDSE